MPQQGETWELSDPTQEHSEQAVISQMFDGHVRLVSRLGRILHIPHRSFELSWLFVHEAPGEHCEAPRACSNQGYLQVLSHGSDRWRWFCEDHLPTSVGTRIMLPGDTPNTLNELPGGLDQCPHCRTSTRHPQSDIKDVQGITVNCCGRCDSLWVLLLARGLPEDGIQISEQIIDTADALHGHIVSLRAFVGDATMRSIQRSIGSGTTWRNGANISGVAIETTERFGTSSAVLIGRPSPSGVQTLGGSPGSTVHNEEDANTALARMAEPSPQAGETWYHKTSSTPAFITEVGETPDKERFVVSRAGTKTAKPSNVWLKDFLNEYSRDPIGPPYDVGAELTDNDGEIWTVVSIQMDHFQVSIENKLKDRNRLLAFDVISRDFKPFKRRSTYERLMDDDEEIDFDVADD